MEIADQILIGIVVIIFTGWVIWISSYVIKSGNKISTLEQSNNGVDADLTSITHQITKLGDDVKSELKEFKDEMRLDIDQIRRTLAIFTKTETDVLKELLNRERK